jgi:hypothetical protein
MELLYNPWIYLIIFLLSGSFIAYNKIKEKNKIKSQFVITGTLLLIFYIVCFLSGICTILNFLFRWVVFR